MDGNKLDIEKAKVLIKELKKVTTYKYGKEIAMSLARSNDAISEMIDYLQSTKDVTQTDAMFKMIDLCEKYNL